MASPTLKPEKKLLEFLKEKQEPFILDHYLLEKSKSINNFPSNSSTLNKKQKPLFPFFKLLLTAIHDKNKKTKFASIKHSSNTTNKHANVVGHVFYEAKNNLDQTERFSTASSSTIFHSCSDIDDDDDDDEEEEEKSSFSSSHKHHNNPLFSLDTFQASGVCNNGIQSQQDTDNKKHHQRCIEVCVTHETWNKDVCGVIGPKKIITESSLLSAALFSSLFQRSKRDQSFTKELQDIFGHDVSHMVKSKNVLHKTKRLFFDCVRELTINLPEKDCKQFMGPEKLGKIIWERTKKWSERGCGNYETNLTSFLNLDYLDSVNEWSEFKTEVKDVSVEIADAILECMMKDEIVSDMFEILSPNTQQT